MYAIRLEDLQCWRVIIARCFKCGHEGEIYPATLRKKWPAYELLRGLKPLLKCDECGNREMNSLSVKRLPR